MNGPSPSIERREELARDLGVEEKTIRVRIHHCSKVLRLTDLELVQSFSQ